MAEDISPHLPKAPIVEAIIQWLAKPTQDFSSKELRSVFTGRFTEYEGGGILLRPPFNSFFIEGDPSEDEEKGKWSHGFLLKSNDKLIKFKIFRDQVVFSRLAPYENWKVFSEAALEVWNTYYQLARPAVIDRLSVRFINRLQVGSLEKLGEVLKQPPVCLDLVDYPTTAYLYRSEHVIPDENLTLKVVRASEKPVNPSAMPQALILDIDVATAQSFEPTPEEILSRLTKLRQLKNRAFFNLITDKALARFQAE